MNVVVQLSQKYSRKHVTFSSLDKRVAHDLEEDRCHLSRLGERDGLEDLVRQHLHDVQSDTKPRFWEKRNLRNETSVANRRCGRHF